MTSSSSSQHQGKRRSLQVVLGLVLGMATGALGAHAVLQIGDRLSPADMLGLFVALVLAGSGLMALLIGSSASAYQRLATDVEPGEAPDGGMLRFARRQGLTNLLAGLLFAAPPIAVAVGLAPEWRLPLFGAIVVLIAIESWVNLRMWREGDELVRTVVTRAGALCFWLLQGIFFLWAAAEKLALVPAVDSWTLLVVLLGVYLVVGSIVSVRSGLATR